MNHEEQPMLYPNGSDLPLGHLIMHKPICTRHSMDPIPIIDCPASFPLTWCPCVLGGQSNPIEAPSILCCCLEHLLNGLYGKTICSKSGSQSLVPRCCIYATAFGLKWNCTHTATSPMPAVWCTQCFISSHFIHIGSSIFLCSLAICPSLSFIGYLKPSNQDNLPHSIIETIQYRYPPSPHRAYSIYKCLQEQTVVSSNRREEYKKLWWNCYSYTGSYNEINNLDYL